MAIRIIMLLYILGCGLFHPASAQDVCDSDVVDYEGVGGRSVTINGVTVFETGNPVLRQCWTRLDAKTGRQVTETRYRFEGDVRIVERGDTVYADVVIYETDIKLGEAMGNVRITDGTVQLNAPRATYFTEEKRTIFNDGVVYQDSTTVLTSRHGNYFSEESRAEFDGEVRLWQKDLYVEADSVRYDRDADIMNAVGRVYIERADVSAPDHVTAPDTTRVWPDDISLVRVFGRRVRHDGAGRESLVSGDVLMLQTDPDSTGGVDSLFVAAEQMVISRTELLDRVIARRAVRVVQGDVSVTADSLVYERIDEGATLKPVDTRLFGSPVAWLKRSQISADSLRLTGRGGSVDSLLATSNVFVAQEDTVHSRIQQLKGRRLVGLMDGDDLSLLSVAPNAETLYYIESGEEGELSAVTYLADRIHFYFEDGDVIDVRSYDGIDGVIYGPEIIDNAQNLSGFRWTPEDRPARDTFLSAWSEKMRRRISVQGR